MYQTHVLCTKHMLFFNRYSFEHLLCARYCSEYWVIVINKTDKIPHILLVPAHLIFTVTLQGIPLHVTYEKLKERLRNLPVATQLESGVKPRLESKVLISLTNPSLMSRFIVCV